MSRESSAVRLHLVSFAYCMVIGVVTHSLPIDDGEEWQDNLVDSPKHGFPWSSGVSLHKRDRLTVKLPAQDPQLNSILTNTRDLETSQVKGN